MRPLHIYLIAYFTLVVGAGIALWRSGAASRISPAFLFFGAFVAVGLGVILAVFSGPRR